MCVVCVGGGGSCRVQDKVGGWVAGCVRPPPWGTTHPFYLSLGRRHGTSEGGAALCLHAAHALAHTLSPPPPRAQASRALDQAVQAALLRIRSVVERCGAGRNGSAINHLWLRLALVSSDRTAAVLFDDLNQVRGGGRV